MVSDSSLEVNQASFMRCERVKMSLPGKSGSDLKERRTQFPSNPGPISAARAGRDRIRVGPLRCRRDRCSISSRCRYLPPYLQDGNRYLPGLVSGPQAAALNLPRNASPEFPSRGFQRNSACTWQFTVLALKGKLSAESVLRERRPTLQPAETLRVASQVAPSAA